MRFAEMMTNTYVLRTDSSVPWLQPLYGRICCVDKVNPTSITLRLTEDCRPVGQPYEISSSADDNGWYDVTDLIISANSCIAPRDNEAEFSSTVSSYYRNYLGLEERVLSLVLPQDVGYVALLGEQRNGKVIFDKTGYYVIDCDDNGFIIAYKGYCIPIPEGEKRKLELSILNLNGTKRQFYPAKTIVSACNRAYEDDKQKAVTFVQNIKQSVILASSESTLSPKLSNTVGVISLG